jgi:RNA polymerase sigma factor (sigma-70 family)
MIALLAISLFTPPVCSPSISVVLTEALDSAAVWVRLAQTGDARAFERVYRMSVGAVHALILRLVGLDHARAEDLTQEVFVRAWQRIGSFRFESKFSTWLHRLALNHVLSVLRSQPALSVELDEHLADEAALAQAQNERARMDLERLIANLPPRARTVLVLHELEGLSHEEISLATGMAVGSSKAQLHRARGLLRKMVEVPNA